jgi:hypothetical protein
MGYVYTLLVMNGVRYVKSTYTYIGICNLGMHILGTHELAIRILGMYNYKKNVCISGMVPCTNTRTVHRIYLTVNDNLSMFGCVKNLTVAQLIITLFFSNKDLLPQKILCKKYNLLGWT